MGLLSSLFGKKKHPDAPVDKAHSQKEEAVSLSSVSVVEDGDGLKSVAVPTEMKKTFGEVEVTMRICGSNVGSVREWSFETPSDFELVEGVCLDMVDVPCLTERQFDHETGELRNTFHTPIVSGRNLERVANDCTRAIRAAIDSGKYGEEEVAVLKEATNAKPYDPASDDFDAEKTRYKRGDFHLKLKKRTPKGDVPKYPVEAIGQYRNDKVVVNATVQYSKDGTVHRAKIILGEVSKPVTERICITAKAKNDEFNPSNVEVR